MVNYTNKSPKNSIKEQEKCYVEIIFTTNLSGKLLVASKNKMILIICPNESP